MPGLMRISVKGDKEIAAKFQRLGTTGRRKAGKKGLARFHVWFANECARAWLAVKAAGGTFRGVTWPGMKPQYTRKDGTEVPAWGGVPFALTGFKRGAKTKITWKSGEMRIGSTSGSVKGKKRPSGKRVTQSSIMMQDTANLRNDFLYKPKRLDDNRMILEPSAGNLEYAEVQNDRRPFAFFVQSDANTFQRMVEIALNEQLREEGLA